MALPSEPAPPTAADIDAAARRLAGVALRTPLVTSPVLDNLVGARVFLKAETLQLIAERGALSTSTLATLLGIDPSTASRNLSGLERSGLIARQKGSDDGRQTDVRLTPRGRRAAQTVGTGASSALGSLLERVPRGDRAKVIDALEVVSRVLEGAQPKA